MINCAVIGAGYWGPNIIRNFYQNQKTTIKICCDLSDKRLEIIRRTYPTIRTTRDYREVLRQNNIDIVAICTPVHSHYKIAYDALNSGKHVLMTKPMTSNSRDAEILLEIADRKNLNIFIDHTFIYTGAVRKIKELVDRKEIGELYYFDSVRVNLGLFQHDVNVLWDLAPHDISIMQYLFSRKPECVIATGSDHLRNGLENIAYMSVYYPDNLIGHIHANWLSPVKVRQTLVAGSKKMIVWDDNDPSEKVRVYNKGIDVVKSKDEVYNMLIQYRTGDMYCPKIDSREALAVEVDHIVDCLENGVKPITDGLSGLRVVQLLEAAQESLRSRGKEVRL